MTIQDEYLPEPALMDAILNKAIIPGVVDCSRELGIEPSVLLIVQVAKQDVARYGNAQGQWTVRLIVRHTFNLERKLFRVQAIVPRDLHTGFNGFMMKGEVLVRDGTVGIKPNGWTGLYNTTGLDDWS